MDRLKRLFANKRVRVTVSILVIALTFGLFGYYLATHPEVAGTITSLSPATLLFLTGAYISTIAANAFVLYVSLRLINKRVGYSENFMLTGYSSIVNFFGPLQSGPGFRAAYLKQKHNVKLSSFFSVTLLFYGFFALINGGVLGVALMTQAALPVLILVLLVLIALAVLLVIFRNKFTVLRKLISAIRIKDSNFWWIGLGALLLSVATTAAYFVELTHVDPGVTVLQTVIYTAAANLALFVSLTPGAIGFRESFLLLSQQLHGISPDSVVAASIIDRAFYIIFLLVLFVVLLIFGVRARLGRTVVNQ